MLKPRSTSLIATSALVLCAVGGGASAQSGGAYLTDSTGSAVKSPYDLCWRTNGWSPSAARVECDPNLMPKPAPVARVEPPPPVVQAEPAPPPPPPPVAVVAPPPTPAPAPAPEKIELGADVFFDFDKATLKPEGKQRLDDLVAKMGPISLEVVIAVGYTDTVGASKYNQDLSIRRADAVKAYLASKAIPVDRITAEGKGEANPIADNNTASGRAKNRRVELEVIGTRQR